MDRSFPKYQRKDPQSLRQAEEVGLIGSRKWTQGEITLLLAEYKKRECLYDMRNPNYRNKFSRRQALDEIARAVCKIRPQTTSMDVKLKFNILRTQYHAELSKEKKYADSGRPHVTTLWFMDHIKFVRGQNRRLLYSHQPNKNEESGNSEPLVQVQYDDQNSYSEDYFDENNDNYDHYDDDIENNEDPLDSDNNHEASYVKSERFGDGDAEEKETSEERDDDDYQLNSSNVNPNQSAVSAIQKRRGREAKPSEHQRKVVQKLTNGTPAEGNETSEEDLFGQIVAKKLKKITNAKKRADTEHKIYNLLHCVLMEELKD